jgi:signal transduction histidine kinase
MDRRSKQKIGYILWALVANVMVIVLSFCSISYESKIREGQIQELVIIYPEIASELQDNFSYYQDHVVRVELFVMAALIFLILFLGGCLVLMEKREKRNIVAEFDNKIDLIYEQLLRFQKGNFEFFSSFEESSHTSKLESVHEKLREMSYYFSDLKLRLTEEENNTKKLITDISHQLKTPLASIRLCHELAKSSELTENERRDFLITESQEIWKMEVLLDELVKLSRLENNMIQIKPEKNSLRQTVSEAISQMFMKAYEKNIEICVDMEKDVEILHDRKWTVEALVNILENAVKYSEPMTTINVRVSYLPRSVLLEIEDEGIGIQEDELHEIFKRFYRGSKAKELVKEGAGVGLYLARNIIEQQGGTIIAKRKSQHGTIFKITLPLQTPQLLL